MNISQKHKAEKPVSAASFFKGEGNATALQILKNGQLKKHTTSIPACLICISGKVVFENEKGLNQTLFVGDYIEIEPDVEHWVGGLEDSHLLLLK